MSLTSQVFLDILERRCDEICNNFTKLPTDVLIKLNSNVKDTLTDRYQTFVNDVNTTLVENFPIWNSQGDAHGILAGKSEVEDDEFGLFLNIKDYRLICIKFYSDGSFGVRKNIRRSEWTYEKYSTYDRTVITDEFVTPWIDDFCDYLEEIYKEWMK